MKSLIRVMLLASLVGGPTAGNAAPVKKAESNPVTKVKGVEVAPLYSTSPIDQGTDTLPQNYEGNNCKAVAKALADLRLSKDEYETTVAYNERINSLGSKQIDGSLVVNDYFAFVQNRIPVSSTYDADSGTLQIKGYSLPGSTMVGKVLSTSVIVYQDTPETSTYTASNAYGKTVEVVKTDAVACALAFSDHRYPNPIKNVTATVAMSPDEARSAKGNIGLLFVGKLAAPYRANFREHLGATIDSPREANWTGDAIVMQGAQVWIFNKATGKIYQKGNI